MPRRQRHLPVPARAEFSHQIRARPAFARDVLGQRQHIDVGVQPDRVQVRAVLVQLVQDVPVSVANGRNYGVPRVELVNHRGHVVDLFPQRHALLRRCHQLEFVADGPRQQRRMILVLKNDLTDRLPLPLHGIGVGIVEAHALLAERQVRQHRQTQRLGAVQRVDAGANRVAAGGHQFFEVHRADCALREIGLAVPEKLPAVAMAGDLHWKRLGGAGRGKTRENEEQ